MLETKRDGDKDVFYLDEDKNEENLVSYKEIKKVHEINNHKKK